MEQLRQFNEEYGSRYDIVTECPNPASSRLMVNITFWRNGELEHEALQSVVDNAQEKIGQCPPCEFECQLKNLANSSPAELRSTFFPPKLKG